MQKRLRGLCLVLPAGAPIGLLTAQSKRVKGCSWDFEVALRVVPSESTPTVFYDTDNDGTPDLIHTVQDDDHAKNTSFTRSAAGTWRVDENIKRAFGSPNYLRDARLAQRLQQILDRGAAPRSAER